MLNIIRLSKILISKILKLNNDAIINIDSNNRLNKKLSKSKKAWRHTYIFLK